MPDTISVGVSDVASSGFRVGETVFAASLPTTLIISVPRDQLYYWSRKWQLDEALAVEDLKRGRACEFANGSDAVRWLLSSDD